MRFKLLIVDDDPDIIALFEEALGEEYELVTAGDGETGVELFAESNPHLVLLDVRLPRKDGIAVLRELKTRDPERIVVMITANKDVTTAVSAMKLGAYDYLVKPFEMDELKLVLNRALEKYRLQKEVSYLRTEISRVYNFEHMVGASRRMQDVFATIKKVLENDVPVLIRGESGTGKELVARAIHFNGRRQREQFVAVNCAALPDNLVESELFGHEKGAFTGATGTKYGKFELADRGTLFLDEIGSLKFDLQAKLLRVLQEQVFERVGGNTPILTDVRIVAATSVDLEAALAAGRFREDLYYRLNVVPINLPPLRERREDIPELVEHFLAKVRDKLGRPGLRVSPPALQLLLEYAWPGNVRELQNVIESTVIMTEGDLLMPRDFLRRIQDTGARKSEIQNGMTLDAVEAVIIRRTLDTNAGNISRTAEVLGVTRKTLRAKMKRYGIAV